MQQPKENIETLIPQRPPFVMVDELVYTDETTSRTTFRVTKDNIFLEDGTLKEPALVENIAQSAAARAGHIANQEKTPVKIGYIGGIKNLQVFSLPKINDLIETEITIENHIFDVTIIAGKIYCKEVLLAQCEMKIFLI
jgi:predicted hotdog family 3-hydroxylacyl-ACP dehydratase